MKPLWKDILPVCFKNVAKGSVYDFCCSKIRLHQIRLEETVSCKPSVSSVMKCLTIKH